MISKKTFLSTMQTLERCYKAGDKVEAAFRLLDPDCQLFLTSPMYEMVLDILEEDMHDNCEWLAYFMFECNWMCECHPVTITNPDGTERVLDSWSDVYDMLSVR